MSAATVGRWGRFEAAFVSCTSYENSFQDVDLKVTFVSPSGRHFEIDGFWDGGDVWRARFAPDETGEWRYTSQCSDSSNSGLHGASDRFECIDTDSTNPFRQHGPVKLSTNRRHLAHADDTPFFWLADTAWNGPLWASEEDWEHYLTRRTQQKFTAVQWVATQWLAAPQGDAQSAAAFTGHERICVNPSFFQRLDLRHTAIIERGLLSAPVLLWTAGWTRDENDLLSPGFILPEDQAVRLACYMVARWGADPVVWIIAGDGDYRGYKADRWKRIGRGVFGGKRHAPVTLHPQGLQWNMTEFQDETWLDIAGYQSGHFDNTDAYTWLVEGPPATDWMREPVRPVINLEPNYEDIGAIDTKRRFTALDVRRAIYRSLLIAPTAGATYGAHGVWDWSSGDRPATGHEVFNTPRPWRESLQFTGAAQMAHLYRFFAKMEWWRLIPAPDMTAAQTPAADKAICAAAARSESGDMALVYAPAGPSVRLDTRSLQAGLSMTWFNVRTGEITTASGEIPRVTHWEISLPDAQDWLMWFHQS